MSALKILMANKHEQQKLQPFPREGVFWVIESKTIAAQNGDFNMLYDFCGYESHRVAWQKLQKAHPELSGFDYEHFPRGRVWKNGDKSVIFIPDCLNCPTIIGKINGIFLLENNFTVEISA